MPNAQSDIGRYIFENASNTPPPFFLSPTQNNFISVSIKQLHYFGHGYMRKQPLARKKKTLCGVMVKETPPGKRGLALYGFHDIV